MISVVSRNVMTSVSSVYAANGKREGRAVKSAGRAAVAWEREDGVAGALLVVANRTLTRAPMTPRLVSRRYSNGRFLLLVFRNG